MGSPLFLSSGLPGVLEVVTGNRRWEIITYDLEIMLQEWLELPVYCGFCQHTLFRLPI